MVMGDDASGMNRRLSRSSATTSMNLTVVLTMMCVMVALNKPSIDGNLPITKHLPSNKIAREMLWTMTNRKSGLTLNVLSEYSTVLRGLRVFS
jgi:hypothetical protein